MGIPKDIRVMFLFVTIGYGLGLVQYADILGWVILSFAFALMIWEIVLMVYRERATHSDNKKYLEESP